MVINQPLPAPTHDRTAVLMELEPAQVMAQFRDGKISRRDVLKLLGALGLTSLAVGALGDGALADDSLTMIIWEGYSSDSFRKPWEAANKATVTATFAGSGDEMFAGMKAGADFDMVSASSDLPKRLFDAGLLAEIDSSKLTNYNNLFDQFKSPPYITFDSKLYGVNFAWGPTIVIYDPAVITTAPTSWNAMLDETYKGKISTWNYPIQIAQYALLLDPKPDNPFVLTDEQLAKVKDILVKQRPLIRKYWDRGGEVADLFLNKEIAIADGWSWISLQVEGSKGKVAEANPTEGLTGWSDSWCISKSARNPDLCYKWADYMIGPDGQQGVITNLNYSITNKVVAASLPAEQQKALRLDDVPVEYAKIHMWQFVAGYDKWVQVWNEATQG